MATDMKIEIVSTETIKPSSPTPDLLKVFKLSLFDQLTPMFYPSILLFYVDDQSTTSTTPRHKTQRLKSSLSRLLTRYYHLAGQINDNLSITCDDNGAKFIEARVDCPLTHVLSRPCPLSLRKFLPIDLESSKGPTGHLLLVQLNYFECGALAVGISTSHKIMDAGSLSTFLKVWSSMILEGDVDGWVEIAELTRASNSFPPVDYLAAASTTEGLPKRKCITRRYVFDSTNIVALKARAASEAVPDPTRVESVLALMWRCVALALRKSSGYVPRRSVLSQAVDLRRWLPEPLPESTIGNFVGGYRAEIAAEEQDVELKKLVSGMRESKMDYMENYVKRLQGEESCMAIFEGAKKFGELISSPDVDFYNSSSLCRLPLYDTDFGWGKPTWVSLVGVEYKNSIVLLDTRDAGGIEVWLTLNEGDMERLDAGDSSEELLQFAVLDPRVSCFCIA